MPEQKFLSQYLVKIKGQDVSPELMNDILEVTVDTSLYLPEMFTMVIQDPDFKWVDDSLFEVGNPVEISVEGATEIGGYKGLLIKGEIAALEPDFSTQGATSLLVRGYNKAHRLHRGKKSRTFLKQTDSDIAKKIAGEVGLSAQVDATSVRYDYVIQSNQTNMEFLQSRAGRLGYQVFATENKLYFKKGEANLGSGPELVFAEGLRSFQPILAATHQVDKIKVMGWDAKQKQVISSEASPNRNMNQGGLNKTGGDTAKSAFGAAETVVVNEPLSTSDEAKALAQGLADDLSSQFIQAEGVCFGHPQVRAGYTITIKGVGNRFSGKYFVTSATHRLNAQGYETHFSISGRHPNTISHLLGVDHSSGGGTNLNGRSQSAGVAPALVTNNKDPENLGRVKVKIPWLGDQIESDWVRVVSPGAGKERGFSSTPEVDDEVLLAFEHGDVHRPYVLGGLWNSKDKPATPNNQAVGGDGKVNQRMIRSRTGHIIMLDDSQGQEQIVIRDKTGKNEIVIDSKTNSMSIKLDRDYTLDVKGNNEQKSTGNVTIDSKGNITVQSMGNTKIKSTGNLDLEATGMLNIKGTQVSVQGTAMAELKAPLVKIN